MLRSADSLPNDRSPKKPRTEQKTLLSIPIDVIKIILSLLDPRFLPVLYATCKTFWRLIGRVNWCMQSSMEFFVSSGYFELAYYAITKWNWNVECPEELLSSLKSGSILRIPNDRCAEPRFVAYAAITGGPIPPRFFQRHTEAVWVALKTLLKAGMLDRLDAMLRAFRQCKCWSREGKISLASTLMTCAENLGWPSVCYWLWKESPISCYVKTSLETFVLAGDCAHFMRYTDRADLKSILEVDWNPTHSLKFREGALLVAKRIEKLYKKCMKNGEALSPMLSLHERASIHDTRIYVALAKSVYSYRMDLVRYYHKKCGPTPSLYRFIAASGNVPFADGEMPLELVYWIAQHLPAFLSNRECAASLVGKSVAVNEWLEVNVPWLFSEDFTAYDLRIYRGSSEKRVEAMLDYYLVRKRGPLDDRRLMGIRDVVSFNPRTCERLWKKYNLDKALFRGWARVLNPGSYALRYIPDSHWNERINAYIECFDLEDSQVAAFKSLLRKPKECHKEKRHRTGFTVIFCECVEHTRAVSQAFGVES